MPNSKQLTSFILVLSLALKNNKPEFKIIINFHNFYSAVGLQHDQISFRNNEYHNPPNCKWLSGVFHFLRLKVREHTLHCRCILMQCLS